MRSASPVSEQRQGRWWILPLVLGFVLAILFAKSFTPNFVLFSNDGPLGAVSATENNLPARFGGTWRPLGWLGAQAPAAAVTITNLTLTVLSPVLFLKMYAPLTLLFTGFCAWLFFRQLRFSGVACVVGGLAAALNTHFFSVACWGLGTWNISAGTTFLALAVLTTPAIKQFWAKAILAGLAVGLGISEGFDVGAILSIYVGVFVLFHGLTRDGAMGRRIAGAFATEVLVVFFAAFFAVHTMATLVMTQVEGISGTKQDAQTRESRWIPDTRWSMPKIETVQIVVPGVLGYRTSQHIDTTNHSSAYWGKIGEDPKVPMLESSDREQRAKALAELNPPDNVRQAILDGDPESRAAAAETVLLRSGASRRFVGDGEYAGIVVALLAVFGLTSAFRSGGGNLSRQERLEVWFWAATALFSLAAAWGRFSFVYHLLYQIPYVSTIRNPIKFLHPFQIAWIILAGYGMESLYRGYLATGAKRTEILPVHLQHWWKKAAGFEKKWAIGLTAAIALSVVAFFVFISSRPQLVNYLEHHGFKPELASQIASFSAGELVWFIALLVLSAWTLAGILSGAWAGSTAKWAGVYLGAILIFDLSRADAYWVHYADYEEKLAPNPVVDFLSDRPFEHRIIGRLEPFGPGSGIMQGFGQLYYVWIQNDFLYHNIQSLDFAQMPRVPDIDRAYSKNLQLNGNEIQRTDLFPALRLWQLTNTRYLLGPAPTADLVNARVPAAHGSLKVLSRLEVVRKSTAEAMVDYSDSTVVPSDNGQYALMEYGEALPRAKLYSNWQTPTNDDAVLHALASRDFDPQQSVLVSLESHLDPPSSDSKTDPGSVTIDDYQPKRIKLSADVKAPAVLLFNDRIDPGWRVYIDGQPGSVLRCNYIMRGVYLTPGMHTVLFRFQPSLKTLYLSICSICIGVIVTGFLVVTHTVQHLEKTAPPPAPPPKPSTPTPAPAPPSTNPPRGKSSSKQKARR